MERSILHSDFIRAARAALTVLLLAATARAYPSPAPSMFADRIARQVGDVITVLLVENTSASASANTNTKSEYKADLEASGSGALDFIPLLSGGGSTKGEHKGDGRTLRRGQLTGTITARIVEVYPSGYLRIEGQKNVIINGEKQTTVLTGVVRTDDINADNTINSDRIADAEISYKGKGVLANTERPGFIARIFDWLF